MTGRDEARALGAIAVFAFREAVGRRLVATVAVLSLCFLGLYALALHEWSVNVGFHQVPALQQAAATALLLMGLYAASLLCALLAIFAAAGAISGEVESGVLQAVLARPVRRGTVVLGKFAGFGAMLLVYALALNGAVMLVDRLALRAPVPHPWAVLAVLCLEPELLLALTLLGSTFLSTLANGASVLLLYGLGTIGGLFEQVGVLGGSHALLEIGVVTSLFIPSDALYRRAASLASAGFGALVLRLAGPFGAAAAPGPAIVAYAVLYAALALALAVWRFSRRDL